MKQIRHGRDESLVSEKRVPSIFLGKADSSAIAVLRHAHVAKATRDLVGGGCIASGTLKAMASAVNAAFEAVKWRGPSAGTRRGGM